MCARAKNGRLPPELPSVVAAIGSTPLVELSRIAGTEGNIFAKLEYLNPGGSKRDRVARRILERAAATGRLAPNQPVVELTSGNTGIRAAMVCAVQGRPFIAVMSHENSSERVSMMRAFGDSDDQAIDVSRRLAKEEGILAGISAGANVAAASRLLAARERGGTIVVLINDCSLKYVSTGSRVKRPQSETSSCRASARVPRKQSPD